MEEINSYSTAKASRPNSTSLGHNVKCDLGLDYRRDGKFYCVSERSIPAPIA